MTQQEILTARESKTWKIKRLFELGLTRKQVANLMELGYGFIQNVYAATYPNRIRRRTITEVIEEAEWILTEFNFNIKFGVEIEAFGIGSDELATELKAAGINAGTLSRSTSANNLWKVTTDSSIQGEKSFELVSPILQGESGLRQLKTVTLILKGLGAKVNKSCGLHIHLDASDFDLQTWKNLYKNYAILEPLIDSFMPNSRRENANYYCKSMRVQNYKTIIDLVNNLQPMESGLQELEAKVTRRQRKFKLNSQAYWEHRSVEFRQHAGTTDFKKISNWILFLARFVEFSKNSEISAGEWESLKRFLPDELIAYFAERKAQLAQ